MNTVRAHMAGDGEQPAVNIGGGVVALPATIAKGIAARGTDEVVVGVRPEHLRVASDGQVPATMSVIESLGHERHLICRLDDGQMLIVRQPSEAPCPKEGESIRLTFDLDELHVFDPRDGERVDS
jgi:multiple sugar transport system ATP-binding protein